jgi:hypothetical protein
MGALAGRFSCCPSATDASPHPANPRSAGRYPQAPMAGQEGLSLCLFDRR